MVNQAIHSLRTLKQSSITFIFFDFFFFYSFLYIYVQLIVMWQNVFSKKDSLFPETMFANCYIVFFNVFPFVSMAIFKPTAEIELLF